MIAALCWALLAQEAAAASKDAPPAAAASKDAPPAAAASKDAPPAAAGAAATAPAEAKDAASATAEINALPDEEPPVAKMRRLPLQPYRLRFWVSAERHPRLGPAVEAAVSEALRAGFRRAYVGAVEMSFGLPPAGAAESPGAPTGDMPPAKGFADQAAELDKVMWIGLETAEAAGGMPRLVAIAREYDVEFQSWGPARRRAVAEAAEIADAALEVAVRQFRPRLAVTDFAEGKKFRVAVQGLALQPADSAVPLLPAGTPVRLRRDIVKRDKLVDVQPIRVTYVIYRTTEPDRMSGVGNLMSALRAPVEPSFLRRGRVLGLAMSVSDDARSELRFVEMQKAIAPGAPAGKRPLAAYEVQIRPQDQAQPIALGNTDRRGRVSVPAALLAGQDGQIRPRACEVKLRIGSIAIKSFPLVPGDDLPPPDIVCAPDPDLPEFTGRIFALQNEIVASLASYAYKSKLLFKRKDECDVYEKKFDERDIPGWKYVHRMAGEINALPKNEFFTKQLDALEAEAKEKAKKDGKKQLSKPIANLVESVRDLLKKRNIGQDIVVKFPAGFDPKMPDPPKRDPKAKRKTVDATAEQVGAPSAPKDGAPK